MEANLNTPQAAPGNESQFMHTAFASDDEMKNFYLIQNRFVNPVSYFMQRSDLERLEDLVRMLKQQENILTLLETFHFDGVGDLTRAFGRYMMDVNIPKTKRANIGNAVGKHMQFIADVACNVTHAKQMSRATHSHIQNVEYLIKKLQKAE